MGGLVGYGPGSDVGGLARIVKATARVWVRTMCVVWMFVVRMFCLQEALEAMVWVWIIGMRFEGG